ncbi:hypothetical protein DM02DRAFT_685075 [Periconia macrospinosa]|uniref:Zn(2)-C6 fungal-type domain-containing protein n=1 Tax=Periconia macrospinosa TaxID=97972 RepID=A0A2V1DH71_9PLEO|nr:hypothetical protein DM02DRAFT_685075 [Periconia macrospinosa]
MVRSHTQELLAGPRPRATCDRCQAQKLRCVKTKDQPECLRCAKHKTSCTFSVRKQRRTRDSEAENTIAETALPVVPHAHGSEFSVAGTPSNISSPSLDTWAMDFNSLFATENLHTLSTPLEPQHHQSLGVLDIIRELAEVNVRLHDHFCTLSTHTHPESSGSTSDGQTSRFFAIDETFTLTNNFITLVRRLQMSLDDPVNIGISIDQATTLLILSCFHRLMDIYSFIAGSIQSCSQNPQLPLEGDQPAVCLPSLQVDWTR